jgi:hypothetical protein
MKKFLIAILILFICFFYALNAARKSTKIERDFLFNKDETVKYSNLNNLNKLFAEMGDKEKSEDYYFVAIGDTRNTVRSLDLFGFNYVAKHIFYARDRNSGELIYDKIKFIVHTGDIVYNGVGKSQWTNLKRAFSIKDYGDDNYPYIKLLVTQKPMFPTLGNHEIMKFLLKKETVYRDVAHSNKGLNHFKDFFNWEAFIANPNIMYTIPAQISEVTFNSILGRLTHEVDKKILQHHYIKKKKEYCLKLFQEELREIKEKKTEVENNEFMLDAKKRDLATRELTRIFRSLGYNTLPVLSTDDMICYAFEIDGLIYLVMDSMARGWHYQTFSDLKHAMYRSKKNRHNLNLFTKSDLNGQYRFFKVVSEYAQQNGKTIVPFLHHSPISSGGHFDRTGREFNYKLMLGTHYDMKERKKSAAYNFNKEVSRTFFDDIFFPELGEGQPPFISDIITSCVHYYEKFVLESRIDGHVHNRLNWYISGGGGGELTRTVKPEKLTYVEMLYNERQKSIGGEGKTIKILNDEVKTEFHFLVVHVKNGRIVDVYPHLIDSKEIEIHRSTFLKTVKLAQISFADPPSVGLMMSADVFSLGLDKIHKYLAFLTWDPVIGLGYLHYDTIYEDSWNSTGIFFIDPIRLTLNFPRSRYTLSAGFTMIFESNTMSRNYISIGIEAPLLYNFFGFAKRWNFQYKYYYPQKMKDKYDPDFGKDIRHSFEINYTF